VSTEPEHVPEHEETPHPRSHRGPTVKEYLRVAAILGGLTAFEVYLSYSGIAFPLLLFTLICAAIVKFVMVVGYFMHLKYDDWRYSRFFLMGLVGALTLYLIVLTTSRVFLE
jgi:cytochrome c oxidase subunit 4